MGKEWTSYDYNFSWEDVKKLLFTLEKDIVLLNQRRGFLLWSWVINMFAGVNYVNIGDLKAAVPPGSCLNNLLQLSQ